MEIMYVVMAVTIGLMLFWLVTTGMLILIVYLHDLRSSRMLEHRPEAASSPPSQQPTYQQWESA